MDSLSGKDNQSEGGRNSVILWFFTWRQQRKKHLFQTGN